MKNTTITHIRAHSSVIKKFRSSLGKKETQKSDNFYPASTIGSLTTLIKYNMISDDAMPLDRAIVNGKVFHLRDSTVMEILQGDKK